jgi:hypothetical protein
MISLIVHDAVEIKLYISFHHSHGTRLLLYEENEEEEEEEEAESQNISCYCFTSHHKRTEP